MWYQKYKPNTLSECVLDHLEPDDKATIISIVEGTKYNNILFWGPPGTGKSTLANLIATDERFVVIKCNGACLQSSAMDEILKSVNGANLYAQPVCVLIDELDCLSIKQQMTIRAMMDEAVTPTVWIFTCNDIRAITDAFKSRIFRISVTYSNTQQRQRHIEAIMERCRYILQQEARSFNDEELQEIVERCYPDIRDTINSIELKFGSIN